MTQIFIYSFAQQVTLTFTGRDANNHFIPLNRVMIGNQTRGWQETIYYPDTTLTMQNGTDISDYAANDAFGLSQNNPNPFNGSTDVNLTVVEPGAVTMEITNVSGRIVETQCWVSPQPGTHQFRVNVTARGVYFLTARQNGKTSSVKMVNNGNGTGNGIEYVGTAVETHDRASLSKNGTKGITNNPFAMGDEMVYIGYATVNGTEYTSQTIHQNQLVSETFTLNFNATYEEPIGLATVTTSQVSDITGSTATCEGTVVNDGGYSVLARGVCWSTNHNPVFNDSHASSGDGVGSFTCQLTGLTPGTSYYVRAYAVNTSGTAYGNEVAFSTAPYPMVTTSSVSDITWCSATCGGNVTSNGGFAVTSHGVCWSTSQLPTIIDNHTTNGSGNGSFTSSITGLSELTTYYVRAYATDGVATAYGDQQTFTTVANPDGQPCPGTSTLTDVDGNTYNTVLIGTQCWMKENLRTTRYADNTPIALGNEASYDVAYRYYPNNSSNNVTTYGYLYNWKAVMHNSSSSNSNPSGVQGICPTGWHVPSDAEWIQLTNYVNSQSSYQCRYPGSGYIAKVLASQTGWSSSTGTCDVGNTPSSNNATGFSALPAGYGSDLGSGTAFWSATRTDSTNALIHSLRNNDARVYRGYCRMLGSYSVRCLRD